MIDILDILDIREVVASEYLDQTTALVAAHQAELESHLFGEPCVNRQLLAAIEATGNLHTLAVFDGDNVVGYAMVLVYPHMHYSATVAQVTSLFLAPEYRKGHTGLKLLKQAEAVAKKYGALYLTWTCKPYSPMANVLAAWGYEVEDVNFLRGL